MDATDTMPLKTPTQRLEDLSLLQLGDRKMMAMMILHDLLRIDQEGLKLLEHGVEELPNPVNKGCDTVVLVRMNRSKETEHNLFYLMSQVEV